ncbi:MAG: response regulator, partial [Leptolyngbyaceae cyanobacterium SL_7_1]|nr:response regulator [Leptolyngbyaceae cyanobacterium SL_7_1]
GNGCRTNAIAPLLWQQARQQAHTLSGSLGMFGLPEGSRLARQIEQLLHTEPALIHAKAASLRQWVNQLCQEIEQSSGVGEQALPAASWEDDRPLLLIVDRDRTLVNQLAPEAVTWGFRVEIATNLTRARDKLLLESPDVVLLDPTSSPVAAESVSLLNELNQQVPAIPVIIFTEQGKLTERLELARLGGCTFLQKPTPLPQVLAVVNQVRHHADRAKAGVMVVDDDLALLAVVRSLLEPWGLKLTTLADPQQFWDVLEAASPDLLVLDIAMPQISGIELCRIVRNDARWSSLPIVFLTAHTDADTINQVFAVGADDFVSKPIVGPELVTRIINRLERMRFLRTLAEIDPLTQLANRQKATQDLDKFLRLAKRQTQPFCLALLNLDTAKPRDESPDYPVVEEGLRQFGQWVRQEFGAEDVVGRWSNQEFVVGFYGMTKQESRQRLNRLLSRLQPSSTPRQGASSIAHSPTLQVRLSGGVAQYPDDGTTLHRLCQAADTALHQAKAAGGDRILLVERQSLNSPVPE